MNIKRGVYPGSLKQFFEQWYKQSGIKDRGTIAGSGSLAANMKAGW